MKKLAWLLTAILILSLAISCAPPLAPAPAKPPPLPPPALPPSPAPPAPPAPAKAVTTIDIGWPMPKNWDADPDIDGIEFDLTPKDAQDKMVETPGVVSAKLWLKAPYPATGKGDLLQEWSNIQVTKDDYDWLMGVTIRLEYKDFEPEEMQFGILEVTFVTPDGKSFTARESSVMLAK